MALNNITEQAQLPPAAIAAAAAPAVAPAIVGTQAPAAAPEAAATAPVELTPRQQLEAKIAATEAKIAKDTKTLEDLRKKLESVDLLDSIVVGSGVEVSIGRAETARNVVGRVLGIDNGRYNVFYGEGLEANTVIVKVEQIVRVIQG